MYTKNNLESCGIYPLRQIGRQIGVKKPSSLKKTDLINAILDLQNGYIKPYFTNKGRPAKNDTEIKSNLLPKAEHVKEKILVKSKKKKKQLVERKLDELYIEFKQLILDLI